MSSTDPQGARRHRQSVRRAGHRPRSAQRRCRPRARCRLRPVRRLRRASLVGRDMRPSGPELVDAFAAGCMEQGIDVVDLGLASTDLVYFAAGTLDAARRHVHGIAQSRAVQRREVLPQRRSRRSGRTPVSRRSRPWRPMCSPDGARAARRASGSIDAVATCSGLRRSCRRRSSTPRDAPAACRRRHGQRHGRSRRACGVRALAANHPGGDVRRARRHVPEPSRRSAATRQPARSAGSGRHRVVRRRTGIRRRRRPRVRRRRDRHAASAAPPPPRCWLPRACVSTPAPPCCTT